MALLAGAGALVAWRQLDTVRTDVQQRSNAVLAQTKTVAAQAASGAELTQALQARMNLAEAKLSALNLQRTQLEELMLSVSRSRDDTLVQDLESSTRFAAQQASLLGSPNALIATLQAGIERISRSAQPRLDPVLQAMQADLERLQAVAGADVPMLVAQLAALTKAIDTLPMRSMVPPLPHKTQAAQSGASSSVSSSTDAAPTMPNTAPSDTANGSWLSNTWHKASAAAAAYWQQWSGTLGQQLKGLVRVRAIDNNDAFLLSPEHAWLLRENLKLHVLDARLALVGAQHDVAAQDLATVAQSVAQYGESGAPQVQQLLDKLQRLQASIQGLNVPMPQSTLAALATAGAGR
ncbi:MAG: uroporphyrinogen-III C-methyltransferase [Burkholderiaceae bacterium]|nr:uroporphyrinogen-III C-methyltransferase [Burkholderiaceae bacterium]